MEMWQKLDGKKKNVVFFALLLVVLYIAYIFSFRHSIKAILLSNQLKREQGLVQNFDASFPQIASKSTFYIQVLKAYEVKRRDRENSLWQAVSGMSIAKDVAITFNPNPQQLLDSNGVFKQQFSFKGNYFNCIELLDSMSKAKGIGRISALKLAATKESKEQLLLKLTLTAVEVN